MALFQRLEESEDSLFTHSNGANGADDITLHRQSDDEQVFHSACVTIRTGNDKELGHGKLFITSESIYFRNENPSQSGQIPGFQMNYRMLSLHATSTDPNISSQPCIYCHLLLEDDNGTTLVHDDDIDQVMLIIPDDPDQLNPMFEALSKGAELHPDSDIEDDDGEEGNFIFNEEEANLSAEQNEALADLDSKLDLDGSEGINDTTGNGDQDGQFDDAEEDNQ